MADDLRWEGELFVNKTVLPPCQLMHTTVHGSMLTVKHKHTAPSKTHTAHS
ncbi:unnamed protein product [Staurois parvus]|uniref:Uncharacterized protein n=1 Tax=Staurois parvus TaxID=386267 RepID=A0ABN9EH06_9NEOB|nr:unnamed protein product [Staurois parvus]